MTVRSRFLRNSSVPPSTRYNVESYRSTSVAPRSGRSTSVAPARSSYRSVSVAPLRASSVVPLRASSVAPRSSYAYRSTSVAPYRAPSVSRIRSSSLAPSSSYSTSSYRASSMAPIRASSVAPLRATSLAPQSSFRASSIAPLSGIDTSIPSRKFGSRLAYQKVEQDVKPAIYDEYYGMTYIPSGGRDSWSAYRISDETLDDNDELVYQSAKKDHDVLKRLNKQIARAMSAPPPKHAPVAPATRKFVPKPVPKIIPVKKQVNSVIQYKPVKVVKPAEVGLYKAPPPSVRVEYGTVDDGEQLLTTKYRMLGKESFDLSQPMAYKSLKQRLNEARGNMDKTKRYMGKYAGADTELSKIDAEVQAIKNSRNRRMQSVNDQQMNEDHKNISDLRKRIRSTLRRSRLSDST